MSRSRKIVMGVVAGLGVAACVLVVAVAVVHGLTRASSLAAVVAVPVGVAAVGVAAWQLLSQGSGSPQRLELRGRWGFLGAPPRVPDRLVARPELVEEVVSAVQDRPSAVALVGMGGSGKSTLAAVACRDPRVRLQFSDDVTWLEAGKGTDAVVLLTDLARRLGISAAESGFATVGQGRDVVAALRDRRVLIAVDNVWDRGQLDALLDLGSGCTVLFTTRRPELAAVFSAAQIRVDELTSEQAVRLLALWAALPAGAPMDGAGSLCERLGNLALAITMAGAMIARGLTVRTVHALIEQDLELVGAELDPAYPYRTLFAAMDVSVADLPDADQLRYAQLAVFANRGSFR